MDCPKCQDECWRHEVDVGVGTMYGPWGCPGCGWSQDPEYDVSEGSKESEYGYRLDQFGGATPPGGHGRVNSTLRREGGQ